VLEGISEATGLRPLLNLVLSLLLPLPLLPMLLLCMLHAVLTCSLNEICLSLLVFSVRFHDAAVLHCPLSSPERGERVPSCHIPS
jgi:hypothetical protein